MVHIEHGSIEKEQCTPGLISRRRRQTAVDRKVCQERLYVLLAEFRRMALVME